MAKKPKPAPLFSLKQPFYDSLDHVAHEGIMLIQAVEMVLRRDDIPKPVAEILRERITAFRAALSSDD